MPGISLLLFPVMMKPEGICQSRAWCLAFLRSWRLTTRLSENFGPSLSWVLLQTAITPSTVLVALSPWVNVFSYERLPLVLVTTMDTEQTVDCVKRPWFL